MGKGTKMRLTFENRPHEALQMPDLPQYAKDDFSIEKGGVSNSEVGPPVDVFSPFGPISCFQMRGARPEQNSEHIWGKGIIGDFGAAFDTTIINVPAEGEHTILNARRMKIQGYPMGWFRASKADAIYILRLDEPLGGSHLLHVCCPEVDDSTITRGLRWKPTVSPCIALYVPWSQDLKYRLDSGKRPGSSGLAIKITTLEDTSTETVATPVKLTVFRALVNISSIFWNRPNDFDFEDVPDSMQFQPIAPPPAGVEEEIPERWYQSDDPKEEGAASGDVQPPPDEVAGEIPSATNEIAPLPEQIPNKGAKVAEKVPGKPQQGALQARWMPLTTVMLGDENLGTNYVTTKIEPQKSTIGGDNVGRAYRRNVWCSGEAPMGFAQGLRIRVVSNRPPQINGLVEFCFGAGGRQMKVFHKLGTATEFNLMFDAFTYEPKPANRALNSPWLRTNIAEQSFSYRMISFNHTTEVKSIRVSIFFAPGSVIFQTPIKPRVAAPTFESMQKMKLESSGEMNAHNMYILGDLISEMAVERDYQSAEISTLPFHPEGKQSGTPSLIQPASLIGQSEFADSPSISNFGLSGLTSTTPQIEAATSDVANLIAPPPGMAGEVGRIMIGGADDEDLDQDKFWIRLPDVSLKPGEPQLISMNLPILEDTYGNGGDTVIAEKFDRFAHVVPTLANGFGPVIGEYKLVPRLPTGITCNIKHVCLPGDMNFESATLAFDLGDILGMAGSALGSIGGPLLEGAVEMIGGGIANAVVPGSGAIIGPLLGGLAGQLLKQSEEFGTTSTVNAPAGSSGSPPSIGGSIPISRHYELCKLVASNENTDPMFGSLALEVTDLMTNTGTQAIETIPMQVFASLKGAKFERSVTHRTYVPSKDKTFAKLPLNKMDVGKLIQELSLSKKPSCRKNAVLLSAYAIDNFENGQTWIDIHPSIIKAQDFESAKAKVALSLNKIAQSGELF